MIAYLRGKIVELDFTSLTLLTSSGVGYEVGINELIYSRLNYDEEISLYIYHHITENNEALFGFLEKEEKKIFTELVKISGIGGKVGMQILSLGVERLLFAIGSEDNKTIEGIKGIGKKMAEKIILELKDKDFGINLSSRDVIMGMNNLSPDLHSSIKSTLANMGYNPRDIDRILSELPSELKGAEEIIPYVIKSMG